MLLHNSSFFTTHISSSSDSNIASHQQAVTQQRTYCNYVMLHEHQFSILKKLRLDFSKKLSCLQLNLFELDVNRNPCSKSHYESKSKLGLDIQGHAYNTQKADSHPECHTAHLPAPRPSLLPARVWWSQHMLGVPRETRLTMLIGGQVHSASASLLPRDTAAQVTPDQY